MRKSPKDTVLVVSITEPKYSEAWMTQMTQDLAPNVVFVSLLGETVGWSETDGIPTYTLLKQHKFLPKRVSLSLFQKKLVKKFNQLLESIDQANIGVLCHYLTTAVYLDKIWAHKNVHGLIHCHGHDVTWNRKVEKLPILPAHGIGYTKKVKSLIGHVSLIANSNCTQDKLITFGFPQEDIYLRYLGVDIRQITPNLPSVPSMLNILYLGRLTDFKGPLETIDAFALAVDNGLKARLDIVGSGHLKTQCQNRVNKLGLNDKITFHGAVSSDIAMSFFQKADIFTAHNKLSEKTGQEEALGVSVLEAMAHGIPVVTGRSGGVKETVLDCETGILFDSNDISAHANAFIGLQADEKLRRAMGKKARQRVENMFDVTAQRPIREILSLISN